MWETTTTDFAVMRTPFRRDIVRETLDAFRAQGIARGLYFFPLNCMFPVPARRRVGSVLHDGYCLPQRSFRSRAALQLEILALRHQLGVLQRSVKRPELSLADRFLWAWLSSVWNGWESRVSIMKAATVIGWQRKGFGLFWSSEIRRGKPGRPVVPKEVRQLIRMLSRENPLWGAPHIHGGLLKLGINVGETSVSKYMVRYLLRDRDRIFGPEFVKQIKAMGIKQVLSAPRSPGNVLTSSGSSARSAASVWIT